jgi:regulator of replication initiation timing
MDARTRMAQEFGALFTSYVEAQAAAEALQLEVDRLKKALADLTPQPTEAQNGKSEEAKG